MLIALFKPYGVLSQFTPEPGSAWRTLADFGLPPGVYPIGRLDADSEGLLLLSDEAPVIKRILEGGHPREYWVQVEGAPPAAALERLSGGLAIQGRRTLPARAWRLAPDESARLPPRTPPIRFRRSIADTWIAMELREGRNRQVRRMTAAAGFPTLRLVRVRIAAVRLFELQLQPGEWRRLKTDL